jgi:hypothetical protein
MYAGALGDNAVDRYAMFLTSLELSADIDERRLALTRARDHGLDMDRVAIATAEQTIENAFEVCTMVLIFSCSPLLTCLGADFATCAGTIAFYHRFTTCPFGC